MTTDLNQLFIDGYINEDENALEKIAEMSETMPQTIASHYYFHLIDDVNYLTKEPEVSITITPKVYFEQNNCLYDQNMVSVDIILDSDDGEIASSSYTMNYPFTFSQVEQFLLSKGFIQSTLFDAFLKR